MSLRSVRRAWRRLLSHLGNARVESDLEREVATHIALLEEDFLRKGMSPQDAHREACRICGGVEQLRQLHRDERGFAWLAHLSQDLRYALRGLRKYIRFSLTTVCTLGLGIGAATAIFTVVWATLIAALPYPHAEQLVMIWGSGHRDISAGEYLDWKRANRSFQDIKAWTSDTVNFSPALSSVPPQSMDTRRVRPGYFHLQGVPFQLGREFSDEEVQPGNDHFVVLVNKTWKQLGADPHILGKPMRIDGLPYIVVGVLAAGVEDRGMGQLVIPLSFRPQDLNRDMRWLTVMGRLRPGVTIAQAQSELNAISAHNAVADSDTDTTAVPATLVEPLKNDFIPRNRIVMLWLLLAAVSFLLLIACVNAANLLLARATIRQQEMAIRGAIGASPRRLFAQCLTESLVLALLGGALGIAVAYGGLRALVAILPPNTLPSEADLTLSLPVLGVSLAVTTLVGLLFGSAPAIAAAHVDPANALRSGGRSSSGLTQRRLRHSLVITEFALALTLLACAALTIHSLRKLMQVDIGMRTDSLFTFRLATPNNRPHDAKRVLATDRTMLDAMRSVPGVRQVAASVGRPMEWPGSERPFSIAGGVAYVRPSLRPISAFDAVSPSYFSTLGIRLIAGRAFTDRDNDTGAKVAMVNESFVRHYLGARDPLTQRLLLDPFASGEESDPPPAGNAAVATPPISWQIVGVFHDVRFGGYRRDNQPEVLLPLWQNPNPDLSFTLRTAGNPVAVLPHIAATLHTIDPDAAIALPRTMEQVRADILADDRFIVVLFSCFGGAALLLAAIGIFGVLSFSVAQRQREIAVRMALGATRLRILSLIFGEATTLTAIGCGIGLLGASIAGQIMHTLLFGIAAFDLTAVAASAALLLLTALLACLLPAHRAAQAQPMDSLRIE